MCKDVPCTKFVLNVYKNAMDLASFQPYPWNHRIVKTGKDPVQTPGPASGPSPWTRGMAAATPQSRYLQSLPPGRQLLSGIKSSQPFLAYCKYFAASNYNLFQSSTPEKAPCSQGRGNPTVTASSNTSSFLLESFWSSPASNGPREQSDCP